MTGYDMKCLFFRHVGANMQRGYLPLTVINNA